MPLAVPLGVGVLIIIVISIAIVVVCKRSGQRKAAQPRHRDEEPLLASGTTTVGADYQGRQYIAMVCRLLFLIV